MSLAPVAHHRPRLPPAHPLASRLRHRHLRLQQTHCPLGRPTARRPLAEMDPLRRRRQLIRAIYGGYFACAGIRSSCS